MGASSPNPDEPLRIAMWSGPRNISTAMMRSFENRPDAVVVDEPFYSFYLDRTGFEHPGRDEILRHHPSDPAVVVESLLGTLPPGKRVFYQKHMAHHLLPEIDGDWLSGLTHAFLIRHPLEVLISYTKKFSRVTLPDTGFPQQLALFRRMKEETGRTPLVLDARDVLEDPRGMLTRFVEALGLEFTEAMLSWPPGRRESDGIWAEHWYAEVEKTTGFQPPREPPTEVPDALREVYEQCLEPYRELHENRLGCEGTS